MKQRRIWNLQLYVELPYRNEQPRFIVRHLHFTDLLKYNYNAESKVNK